MSHSNNDDEEPEQQQKQKGSSSKLFSKMIRSSNSSKSLNDSQEISVTNNPDDFHRNNDDTASNRSGQSGQGPYQIIEYDINEGMSNNGIDVMGDLDPLHIDDDSPAAAALRANANVKVSTMGKAARAVHLQTVRKIVKRASLASKSGIVRGKPPRLPPTIDGGIADFQSSRLGIIDESAEITDESFQHDTATEKESTATLPVPVVAGTAEAGKKGMYWCINATFCAVKTFF